MENQSMNWTTKEVFPTLLYNTLRAVIPVKTGIQIEKPGFRIKCGMTKGSGMTKCVKSSLRHCTMYNHLKLSRLSNKGFTLLEVLIAVVILAVGLLAIGQMQIIAIRFNVQGRDTTEASTLATDHLECLKTLPVDHADLADTAAGNNGDLTDTGTVDHNDPNNPIDSQGNAGGKYTRIWNVADGAGTKSVMVIVSWLSGPNRIPRQVQFPTVIANPNP